MTTTMHRPTSDHAPMHVHGETIVDVFRETALTRADRPAMRWRKGAEWRSLTWAAYELAVEEIAVGLRQSGLATGWRSSPATGRSGTWLTSPSWPLAW